MYKTSFIALLLLALSACASVRGAKTNEYAPAWDQVGPVSRIHLFPTIRDLSFDVQSVSVVQDALNEAVMKMGCVDVVQSAHEDLRADPGEKIFRFDRNARDLHEMGFYQSLILASEPADLYVFPAIVHRVALLDGRLAKWDGVRQELETAGRSGAGYWSGTQAVHSLRLEVFDSSGTWLMTSYGGISVPVVAHLPSQELRPKEDPFADAKDQRRLAKGIGKAVQPFMRHTGLCYKEQTGPISKPRHEGR